MAPPTYLCDPLTCEFFWELYVLQSYVGWVASHFLRCSREWPWSKHYGMLRSGEKRLGNQLFSEIFFRKTCSVNLQFSLGLNRGCLERRGFLCSWIHCTTWSRLVVWNASTGFLDLTGLHRCKCCFCVLLSSQSILGLSFLDLSTCTSVVFGVAMNCFWILGIVVCQSIELVYVLHMELWIEIWEPFNYIIVSEPQVRMSYGFEAATGPQ